MQQIRNKAKTKRMILQNKLWNHSLCKILNYILVRYVDLSWNTIEPSLILMHEKLTDLGWVYYNGEIHIVEHKYDS